MPFPAGFEPDRHAKALPAALAKKGHGEGWRIESIDPDKRVINIVRERTVTEVTEDDTEPSAKRVNLTGGMKPSDGDKVAVRMADQYPGFHLVKFEPFLNQATLAKMTDDEVRARGAIAVALSCKPWDVMVRARSDGGYDVKLPHTYVPSKHDDKLEEAATVIGKFGWYVTVDAKRLIARVVPSEPPTFPPMIPYPIKTVTKGPKHLMPIGVRLGKEGKDGPVVAADFEASPHLQLSGTSGSGKSVLLNGMIFNRLMNGAELVIVDLPHKAVDFTWVKRFVRPGGWGCDSLEGAVAATQMAYNEGMRRAGLLKEYDVAKLTDLPEHLQPPDLFILFDEVTGLIQLDPVPKGIPKDHPLVMKANETNLLRQTLLDLMKRISAELRFVGLRMALSSQVANSTTGIPPALKTNLNLKLLAGSNPTKANRGFALLDPTRVPEVPDNIKSDAAANRGVGVYEFEGQEPGVYKAYFATTSDFQRALMDAGVPTTDRPAPTKSEIAKYTPSLDESGDDDDADVVFAGDRTPSGKPLDPRFGPVVSLDENGRPLKGAAAAAAASKKLAAVPAAGPPCPDCGEPITATGECAC